MSLLESHTTSSIPVTSISTGMEGDGSMAPSTTVLGHLRPEHTIRLLCFNSELAISGITEISNTGSGRNMGSITQGASIDPSSAGNVTDYPFNIFTKSRPTVVIFILVSSRFGFDGIYQYPSWRIDADLGSGGRPSHQNGSLSVND